MVFWLARIAWQRCRFLSSDVQARPAASKRSAGGRTILPAPPPEPRAPSCFHKQSDDPRWRFEGALRCRLWKGRPVVAFDLILLNQSLKKLSSPRRLESIVPATSRFAICRDAYKRSVDLISDDRGPWHQLGLPVATFRPWGLRFIPALLESRPALRARCDPPVGRGSDHAAL